MRYSDVARAESAWRFPNYLLNDREAYDDMLKIIKDNTAQPRHDDITQLIDILEQIKQYAIHRVRASKERYRKRHAHLRSEIAKNETALGMNFICAPGDDPAALPQLSQVFI